MLTLLIFVLLILALLFLFLRCKKTGMVFLVTSIILFFIVGSGTLVAWLLPNLQKNNSTPKWQNNNAIVLLGAGSVALPNASMVKPTFFAYSRIMAAASLYFSCKQSKQSCTLFLSGGDPSGTGQAEAVVYQQELVKLGVPVADMILEARSNNTYQNAKFTSPLLKAKKDATVYLVTSGIHLRRSCLYFSNFGIQPIPYASDYFSPMISVLPNGYHFAITDLAVHEYLGILRFYVYNYLGWNAPRAKTS